jgi:hypothetical protein
MWAAAAMELTVYMMLSGIEIALSSEKVKWQSIPWKRYIIISFAIATGRGLTYVFLVLDPAQVHSFSNKKMACNKFCFCSMCPTERRPNQVIQAA